MRLLLPVLPVLALLSCRPSGPQGGHAPIVLGDSATIVTETDSQYLKSAFSDFEAGVLPEKAAPQPLVATPPAPDTAAVAAPAASPAPAGPGLKADFGTVQVFVENLRVRNGDQKIDRADRVAYSSDGSAFSGKNLVLTGAAKGAVVQQKTDYGLVLNTGKELLPLPALGTQSTGWQALSGNDGKYPVASAQAPAFKLSNARIKSAAQEAARKAKMNRKDETALLDRLRNVKTVDGDLITARPATLHWQVKGKDGKGKAFTKEIRVDF